MAAIHYFGASKYINNSKFIKNNEKHMSNAINPSRESNQPHRIFNPCLMTDIYVMSLTILPGPGFYLGRSSPCLPIFFSITEHVSASARNFLVVTGAEISVLPPTGIERRNNTQGPAILAANGSNIKTYGRRAVTLDLPPGRF